MTVLLLTLILTLQPEDLLMRLGPARNIFGRLEYRAESVEIYKKSPELREELYQIGMMVSRE